MEIIENKDNQANIRKRKKKWNCSTCKIKTKQRYCTSCGKMMNMEEKNQLMRIEKRGKKNIEIIDHFATSRVFFPHHLREPIYCVLSLSPNLNAQEYHGGFAIVQALPEKSAFFLGSTPDKIISHPIMRKRLPMIDMVHYENYGKQMFQIIEGSDSFVLIKVLKKKIFNIF